MGLNSRENVVYLTVQQHAEVHLFLFELNENQYDNIAFLALSGQIGKEEATARAIRESNKRKIITDEIRQRMSVAMKKRILSPEAKQNQRKSQLGNKNTLGYKHSEEMRHKMSIRQMGKKRGKYKSKPLDI